MKKGLLFLAIAFCCSVSYSQNETIVYKTYDDFLKGTGEKMEKTFASREWNFGTKFVKFKKLDGGDAKYAPKNMWGFITEGHLFRSCDNELGMLADTGKIDFWINGFAALEMIWHPGNTTGSYMEGESQCLLSVGITDARLYRMPITAHVQKDYKQFQRDYPDFQDLYDCINIYDMSAIYLSVQNCVSDFNASHKSQKQYAEDLSNDPKNPHVLSDYGTYYIAQYDRLQSSDEKHAQKSLDSAIIYLKQSYDINPKDGNTTFKLSKAYLRKNDCENARKFYDLCKAIATVNYTVMEDYKKELKKKCGR